VISYEIKYKKAAVLFVVGETILLLNNASRQALVFTQLIATGHREVFPRVKWLGCCDNCSLLSGTEGCNWL
jgi:hypothetical protein